MNNTESNMDNIEAIKGDLDKLITPNSPNVGIAFGEELFSEFKSRGWLTLESFGALGTTLFAIQVPAYQKTHFAFVSWHIAALAFKVGTETEEANKNR